MLSDRSKKAWPIVLALTACLTIGVSLAVDLHLWRIGIPGEWQWDFYPYPADWAALGSGMGPVLGLLAVVLYGLYRGRNARVTVVLLVILILISAFAVYNVLPTLSPYWGIEDAWSMAAPHVGGYYAQAVRVDRILPFLAGYHEYIAGIAINDPLRGHISDHPPGPIVVHWSLNRTLSRLPSAAKRFYPGREMHRVGERLVGRSLSEAEAGGIFAAAMFYRLMAALTVIPAYLLARALYSPRAGLMAAGLAAIVPALHVFSPYPDQMLPVVALFALWLFWRAALGRRLEWLWAAGAGLVLFFGMQFTLAPLTLLFMMAVAGAMLFFRERAGGGLSGWDRWRWGRIAAGLAAGLLLPTLASHLALDYHVMDVWQVCLTKHAGFAETFGRTYWKWALFGPVEVAVFTGVPVACLVIWRAAGEVRSLAVRRAVGGHDVLLGSLLVTALVLNLSGKSLGEVGRLWMFLMPAAAVVAAGQLAEQEHQGKTFALIWALMFLQTMLFCASLNVFGFAFNA